MSYLLQEFRRKMPVSSWNCTERNAQKEHKMYQQQTTHEHMSKQTRTRHDFKTKKNKQLKHKHFSEFAL